MDKFSHRFPYKSTYDMMPSPVNMFKWKLSADDKCMCGEKGTLFHILVNCPLGLASRYTWRHNHVLQVIADAVKAKLEDINSGKRPQIPDMRQEISFHREGLQATPKAVKMVDDSEWRGSGMMTADIKGGGFSLSVETRERSDIAVYCEELKKLMFLELTICWEAGMEEARARKEEPYKALVEQCEEQGWEAKCLPIEVGVRGFVGNRTMSLFQLLTGAQ